MQKTVIISVIVLIAVIGGIAYSINIDRNRVAANSGGGAVSNSMVYDGAASMKLSNELAIKAEGKYKVIPLKIQSKVNSITVEFQTEIADTKALEALGLSGRSSIDKNKAMLFIFPKDDFYSFWMKDMNFSIDMIWISEKKEIVHIVKNATPESYPATYMSDRPAKYVLEVHEGIAQEYGLKEGDTVQFEL